MICWNCPKMTEQHPFEVDKVNKVGFELKKAYSISTATDLVHIIPMTPVNCIHRF